MWSSCNSLLSTKRRIPPSQTFNAVNERYNGKEQWVPGGASLARNLL